MEVFIDGVKYVPFEEEALPEPEPEPEFNSAAFFSSIRSSLFGGSLNQDQVDGVQLIGNTCMAARLDPLVEQSAYVLATVYHETARTMQPIAEYGGPSTRYAPWYGRGHVQLTWETNYLKQENKLGVNPYVIANGIPYKVHQNRSLALHPETSALICVLGMQDGDFTGKKLSSYINDDKIDYVNARRIVNGTDKASTIASYAEKFEAAIKAGING